ncbi:MAG: hypothetical protein HW421_255 [Ignavibacteria bacterium]|nr:hypothetical protein [Ignavibacteria bacterium]
MKDTILYLLLFSLLTLPLFSEKNLKESIRIANEALDQMDSSHFYKAIELFNRALELEPNSLQYQYEKALAYFKLEKYDTAITLLSPLRSYKDTKDHVWQLLGNSYDLTGKRDSAFIIYQEGLQKFPNSGRLYLEMGISYLSRKKGKEASGFWEKGVIAAPEYPLNYYYLTKHFAKTAETIWAIFYGEIFLNLNADPRKKDEISKLLYQTYINSIFTKEDTIYKVRFTQVSITSNTIDSSGVPFQIAFQKLMEQVFAAQKDKADKTISIGELTECRLNFIILWNKSIYSKRFPNLVLKRLTEVLKNKYFDEYNFYIFKEASPGQFDLWSEKNMKKYGKFLLWLDKNPLRINQSDVFHRFVYDNR